MKKCYLLILSAVFLTFMACSNNDDTDMDMDNDGGTANFTVTIENVVTPKPIFQSGVFAVPVGGTDPAPIFPGEAYEFMVDAGPVVLPNDGGTRLSFVTMFVQSNDLFFAPDEEGIALYNTDGSPIGAGGPEDVTDQVLLWDSGTEVNEETGGPNQKPQQDPMAEDQGVDENGVVAEITGNMDAFGNVIPDNNAVVKVTIENVGPAQFKVRIENVSDMMTIATPGQGAGTTAGVPMSPGVYAVHTMSAPFFTEGDAAAGAGSVGSMEGVENIAEDGFPEALAMDTEAATGLINPLSPGAWAIHEQGIQPIYQINMEDFGEGLEGVAEDGVPTALAASLDSKDGVKFSDAFDTAVGASMPGAIGPGGSFRFTCIGSDGDNLSLVTMFIQSNDWFYAFPPNGIPLFENGQPISGDITANVFLYDAGTEADEYPGAGLNQVIRQADLNSGDPDANTDVRLLDPMDLPNVPPTNSVIRITITPDSDS